MTVSRRKECKYCKLEWHFKSFQSASVLTLRINFTSEFQTVTAGKYKRTLTPTKKATKEDFQKTKEDVENILVLFKRFVKENRPILDIDAVATGETWFGTDALERGLCDEIKTADTCLTEFVDNGYNVYDIKYSEPPTNQLSQFLGPASDLRESSNGMFGRVVRWLVSTVKSEIEIEFAQSTRTPIDRRYLMQDDTLDQTRLEG
jgi:ClpP class serine protease